MKQVQKGKRNQDVQIQIVKFDDIKKAYARKMTPHDPSGVHIKGGIPNWVPRKGPNGGWFIYDKDHVKRYISTISDKKKNEIFDKDPHMRDVFAGVGGSTSASRL